ncbi:MAG TPA: pentapeptide repeat-containing protein, partial [Ktedonobacteraceae bacterium]
MANPEHLEILKQGVAKWNEWRRDNPGVVPDLKEADLVIAILREIDLKRVNLSDADLSFADLSEADLRGADLSHADLSGANLSKANLISANLTRADLSTAILSDADLGGADLGGADLSDADFSRAILYEANLSETDLSRANLSDANLNDANLWIAYCSEANLSMANLSAAKLIDTVLNGAILTGACLWETQRAGWSINGVICEYVYWGNVQFDGLEETFNDDITKSFYAPGEFERLFAEKAKVRLFYKDGFEPLEFDALPTLIKHLEDSHPVGELCMVSVREDSGGVVVELAIKDTEEHSPEQLKQLKVEIETTAQRAIEFERKFLAEEKIKGQLEARLDELRLWFGEQLRLLASTNQFNFIGGNMGDTYNVSGQAGAVG